MPFTKLNDEILQKWVFSYSSTSNKQNSNHSSHNESKNVKFSSCILALLYMQNFRPNLHCESFVMQTLLLSIDHITFSHNIVLYIICKRFAGHKLAGTAWLSACNGDKIEVKVDQHNWHLPFALAIPVSCPLELYLRHPPYNVYMNTRITLTFSPILFKRQAQQEFHSFYICQKSIIICSLLYSS